MAATVIFDEATSPTLPDATTSSKGVVQVGSGLSVSDGVVSVDASTLPMVVATTTSAGVVRPDGETIAVDQHGVISVAPGAMRDGPYLDVRTDSSGRQRLAIVIPEE